MPSPEEISRQLNDIKFMYEQAIFTLDDAAEKLSYAIENAVNPFIDDMIECAETGYIDMQRYNGNLLNYSYKCPGEDDSIVIEYTKNAMSIMQSAWNDLARISQTVENEFVDWDAID